MLAHSAPERSTRDLVGAESRAPRRASSIAAPWWAAPVLHTTARDSSKVTEKMVERVRRPPLQHAPGQPDSSAVSPGRRVENAPRNEPPHMPRSRRSPPPALRHRGGQPHRDARRIRLASRQCKAGRRRCQCSPVMLRRRRRAAATRGDQAVPPAPGAAARPAPRRLRAYRCRSARQQSSCPA